MIEGKIKLIDIAQIDFQWRKKQHRKHSKGIHRYRKRDFLL